MAEMTFLNDVAKVTVVAVGAYGREASVLDWDMGKDFYASVAPPGWVGGRYFSRRNSTQLKALGVQVVMLIRSDASGFLIRL